MKLQITMKTPDSLADSILESVNAMEFPDLSKEEAKFAREDKLDEISEICKRWFKYGEYLTVEVDTEAKTCVVVDA